MQPQILVLLVAALQSASILAAPVAVSAAGNVVEVGKRQTGFRTAAYAHLYREAADAGLAEAKEKRQTGFRTAAYAHLYREAADAGLAEEKAEDKRRVAEAEDAVLVDRDAEKEQIYSLGVLRKEGEEVENVQTYKPTSLD
ncbi:hypothetical protein N0V95_000647 [Ascochyta clinopodiicola]|nr:hypothetical protein N0V95_000647 [Ascochyta clinopodiicola]